MDLEAVAIVLVISLVAISKIRIQILLTLRDLPLLLDLPRTQIINKQIKN